MAKDATYSVKFRRRREAKTSYARRLGLLKSGKPRLVVRVTNTRILSQIVEYRKEGDKVLTSYSSDQLKKLGWVGSVKNIKAAYLTGYAIGKSGRAKQAILDAGISKPSKRVMAALKGAVDAGMDIAHNPENLPAEEGVLNDDVKHVLDKLGGSKQEKTVKKPKAVKKEKKVDDEK